MKRRVILCTVLTMSAMVLLACSSRDMKETDWEKVATAQPYEKELETDSSTPTPEPTPVTSEIQSDVVGTWVPYAMDYDGKKKQIKKIKKKIIQQVAEADMNPAEAKEVMTEVFRDLEAYQITFKANGTFICKSKGKEINGTWVESNSLVTTKVANNTVKYNFKKKKLSIGNTGQAVYFKKKK